MALQLIGSSVAFRQVLDVIDTVAPVDSPVLLMGETGTGKELVARAIHDAGPRGAQPFVAVNCAAIPLGLLESELFGYERGAFTGATSRRNGRFQAADGGTLFLDEIGDLPLELQPKRLCVLQEQQIERPGGAGHPTPVDVRVIERAVIATKGAALVLGPRAHEHPPEAIVVAPDTRRSRA